MTELLQTEHSTSVQMSTPKKPVQVWQVAVIVGLVLWLYWPTLAHLVSQWWNNPNFSHGFFVPLFSGFVIWQDRERLACIPRRPSWSGVLLVALGTVVLIIGQMGAELFLSRSSLLLVIAGLTVLFRGWKFFRAILFPWAFLILMIPIPAIVFNQITFPLQLLASRLAAAILPVLGVPILREGNVINLPSMALEVAEACSGIRSLMSLVTLAIIYGYFLEKRLWVRSLLAVASVPIAVVANSIRIIGTGLLVQYWDPDKAEGYFHASWGLIIFVVSLIMLYALHSVVNKLWRETDPAVRPAWQDQDGLAGKANESRRSSLPRFLLAACLLVGSALLLRARSSSEVFPPRSPLESFPSDMNGWTGTDIPIEKDALEKLGPGDFLLRVYTSSDEKTPYIDLYIAYFPSQRTGDTIHSPKNCLPGAGWSPIESRRMMLSVAGHAPFPVNRYVISKGDSRQLVLYWYWAHDRGVASEYWAKYYLVADSIRMNRSDGALVRVTTPILSGESADTAQQRLLPFVSTLVPQLQNYIPR